MFEVCRVKLTLPCYQWFLRKVATALKSRNELEDIGGAASLNSFLCCKFQLHVPTQRLEYGFVATVQSKWQRRACASGPYTHFLRNSELQQALLRGFKLHIVWQTTRTKMHEFPRTKTSLGHVPLNWDLHALPLYFGSVLVFPVGTM